MAVVYRIQNLTKIYRGSDRKANDDLTFDIHEGEIIGLPGPNGAGKSTLVNQAAGLVCPTAGSKTNVRRICTKNVRLFR